MRIVKSLYQWQALLIVCALLSAACSNSESYTDRLNKERQACNAYLATKRVVNAIPADTVFETGSDAPFYRIDPDGNVYMQVIRAGNRVTDRVRQSETIYFRCTRSNLETWLSNGRVISIYDSNEIDMSSDPYYFNYNDYSLPASAQWGYGVQLPLSLLGVECEVNLVIKSQYGVTSEMSNVMPFLWHVRYYHSQI